ncbi:hypothetical protein CRM22_004811 [Opisthorchis felineus]|uniref:Uncharacterized protein n=1 Tax=Opisthorchis felineus TaxID=147828 RepID=A0A4V6RH13_OPIFE|nr:hypothetical protein CRM22_004811 [Opisthorchis felineus]
MQARLIVAVLVIVGAVFGAVHIALSLYSAVDKNWVQFTVPSDLHDEKLMETQNRRRGLLVECVDDKDYCHYLEGLADQDTYPNSREILRLRSTAPALAYSSIILAALAYTLGGIAFAIFRNKPRRRQVLLLFFGVFAWIAAALMFCCIIVFLELRNQEAHKFDQSLPTIRSSWSRALRKRTVEQMSTAFKVAVASAAIGHIGSFSMMAASVWA